jgi:hypothetical protein
LISFQPDFDKESAYCAKSVWATALKDLTPIAQVLFFAANFGYFSLFFLPISLF